MRSSDENRVARGGWKRLIFLVSLTSVPRRERTAGLPWTTSAKRTQGPRDGIFGRHAPVSKGASETSMEKPLAARGSQRPRFAFGRPPAETSLVSLRPRRVWLRFLPPSATERSPQPNGPRNRTVPVRPLTHDQPRSFLLLRELPTPDPSDSAGEAVNSYTRERWNSRPTHLSQGV